ncbi:hypothetical protein ACHAXA_006445 [Cyclostephanos tholiformis]|uniref:Uncharacterized protein n=1 Tax=Cyclostephanos tholiformis TaxID=382380 RepID=A0ABD3SEZ6_9STRA
MSTSFSFPFCHFHLIPSSIIIFASAQTDDNYCGATWDQASTSCLHPCPKGDDSECSFEVTGERDYFCYILTGCKAKIESGEIVISSPTSSPIAGVTTTASPTMSPTLPMSSMSMARIGLILSLVGLTSVMDQDSMAEFNATLFDYIQEAMMVGGDGMVLNMTNVTKSRLGDSFDYVDAYVEVDVFYDPSILVVTDDGEVWEEEAYLEAISEWAYEVIEGHILGKDGMGTSFATILAESGGLLGGLTNVYIRMDGPAEFLYTAPASSNATDANGTKSNTTDSNATNANATNSNVTGANVSNATNATTGSFGSTTSASPSSSPSLGYDSAAITTSAPSASTGSSSPVVPASAKGVDATVKSTSGESDYDLHDKNDGDSRTGMIVGIFSGILVPCLVGIGLLYRRRMRRSSRMDLDDAKSNHVEIGPRGAEAMAKRKNEAYHPDRRDKRMCNGGSIPRRTREKVASHRMLETCNKSSNGKQVRIHSNDKNVDSERKSSRKNSGTPLHHSSGRQDAVNVRNFEEVETEVNTCTNKRRKSTNDLLRTSVRQNEDYIMRSLRGVAKDDNKRTNRMRRSTNDVLCTSARQDRANLMRNFEEVARDDNKRTNKMRRSTNDLHRYYVREGAAVSMQNFEKVAKNDNKRTNRMRMSTNDLLRASG